MEDWSMPTMGTYVCTLNHTEELAKTGDARKFRFRFEVVPADKIGKPDEGKAAEQATIEVKISETVVETSGYRDDDVERVAYWCVVEDGLKAGKWNEPLEYNSYKSDKRHPCDPRRIDYPPPGPFEIEVESRIGF
jgi:hypothetical protein